MNFLQMLGSNPVQKTKKSTNVVQLPSPTKDTQQKDVIQCNK